MRVLIILALLCIATQARGEGLDLTKNYPFGSRCLPSHTDNEGRTYEPVCTPLTYAPVGSTFRKSFHEELPWTNLKGNRVIPLRAQTTDAAPK